VPGAAGARDDGVRAALERAGQTDPDVVPSRSVGGEAHDRAADGERKAADAKEMDDHRAPDRRAPVVDDGSVQQVGVTGPRARRQRAHARRSEVTAGELRKLDEHRR
jgi:hypothetical protein